MNTLLGNAEKELSGEAEKIYDRVAAKAVDREYEKTRRTRRAPAS